jgi:hypothetical protein
MNPVGVTDTGDFVFTTSPETAHAAALFAQLQAWREKGFDPQLWGNPGGWTLVLDMTHWGVRDINERNTTMLLRFNTELCATPQAAIEAALQVVQP